MKLESIFTDWLNSFPRRFLSPWWIIGVVVLIVVVIFAVVIIAVV